jgi:hypothetical protein
MTTLPVSWYGGCGLDTCVSKPPYNYLPWFIALVVVGIIAVLFVRYVNRHANPPVDAPNYAERQRRKQRPKLARDHNRYNPNCDCLSCGGEL